MDAAERKARAVGILVAAFKRLLWETAVAQEQAGSAKHCWVLPQSCLANSTLLCFAWILHTFPGASTVPGPTAWLGVESSGVTLVQIKLYTTVTAPARALSISCRKPLIANPRGLAATLCHKMQLPWPSWGVCVTKCDPTHGAAGPGGFLLWQVSSSLPWSSNSGTRGALNMIV